jgi:1-acyl-sn-glycerol-3-phosphate acyltransferase
MLGSIRVVCAMSTHYLKTMGVRKKYSVYGKDLEPVQKRENRIVLFEELRALSNGMFRAAKTKIELQGEENLPTEGPVVYIANHRGIFDTPLIASIVKEPVIFIGKKELQKAPIIGEWFNVHGNIYIDRKDMRSGLEAIVTGIKELKEGQSVVIFPEGTRSKTGELGEFKAGSFKLALKANVPIVPIAILGTEKILEEKGKIQQAHVKVKIGKIVDVPNFDEEKKKKLHLLTQKRISDLLEELKEQGQKV